MSQNQIQNESLQQYQKKHSYVPEQLLLNRDPEDQLLQLGDFGSYNDKYEEYGHDHAFNKNLSDNLENSQNFVQKNSIQKNNLLHSHQYNNQTINNAYNGYQDNKSLNQANNSLVNQANNQQEQKSPKRKCICKKTQCLKMYCECFALNMPCTSQCVCMSCKNTLQHQKEIFEAKMNIREKGIVGLHSCSLSQKRCNCKKSNCLKKYCECFNSGVKCSQGCKCVDCKNCNQQQNNNKQEKSQQKIAVQVKKKGKKVKKQAQKKIA